MLPFVKNTLFFLNFRQARKLFKALGKWIQFIGRLSKLGKTKISDPPSISSIHMAFQGYSTSFQTTFKENVLK